MNSNVSLPVEVPLSQGAFAKVDQADLPLVARHRWHLARCGQQRYAATNVPKDGGGYRRLYMHRLLAGVDGLLVDHFNRDGLDNTRANLRPCDYTQNNLNRQSSRDLPKGVYAQGSGYVVKAKVRKKTHYLGFFADRVQAEAAASQLFSVYGEDARFVPGTQGGQHDPA